MSNSLKKRGREPEALLDSTDVRESKRFNSEETDQFPHLPLFDKTLAEGEECAPGEDLVSGVIRSLEEEISATCSGFYTPILEDNSTAVDSSSGHEAPILFSDSDSDLCYLLEASDDELGIPSSLVLDDEFCKYPNETLTAEGLSENPDRKCQGENWDFENEFENYQQFALSENAWDASQVQVQDYMNRDFVSQDMCFHGDFSEAWTFEIADFM